MLTHIRQERKKDRNDVELLTREAFYKEKDLQEKGFGCSEHYMVHLLRKKDGIKALNLVAEINGEIVGHIIYSKATIITDDNQKINVLSMGPLTVKKAHQNKGIGTKLMRYSLDKARQLGYGAVLIFGHTNYYPRFGFLPASQYHITTKEGDNFDAFMALELKKGFLDHVAGKFIESSVYDEDQHIEHIKAYDLKFQTK